MIDDDKFFDARAMRPMPKPPQELLDREQQRLALTARDPSVILERRELRAALEGALDEICDRAGAKAERNRAILEWLWLDEAGYTEVGREFGIAPKRVKDIETKAQQRLIPLQHRFHDYKDNLPELVVVARASLAIARAEQYRARRDRTPS